MDRLRLWALSPVRPASPENSKVVPDANRDRLGNLYSEAATLTDAVVWLKDEQSRARESKPGAKSLVRDVLRLLNDGLLPDGSRVERVDSEGLWITRDNVTLPLEQVSDGYRTVTALVVDLARRLHSAYFGHVLSDTGKELHRGLELSTNGGSLHCPFPGVVLIDEVDMHMHVEWQQKIGFWLTAHFPKIQFLTTSHSPFVCQAAGPRGIIRLPAPGEQRTMEHLDPRLFNAVVNGGADDAVMSELFGLEHAHSEAAEILRDRVAALEFKLITDKATTHEKREYEMLRSKLPTDIGEEADRKRRMARGAERAR
jgi:AAA domain, putative AbiEii toxin, Type IV TA system